MINFWQKLFNSICRYSLAVSKVYHRNAKLTCILSDKTNLNPYEIFVEEIFSNDNLLSQIKPRELLKLKELYDSDKLPSVVLMESCNNNKFKVRYHDREFTMMGKDICNDMNLLKSMRFEDAFRVIYNTACKEATFHFEKLLSLEITSIQRKENINSNIINLNNKNKK